MGPSDFKRMICKIVGHNMKVWHCTRCGFEDTESGIRKVANALMTPLKRPLNYEGIGRKLFKTEKLDLGKDPIYDEDAPKE